MPHFNFPALDFSARVKQSFASCKLNYPGQGPSIIFINPVKQNRKPIFCRMEDKICKRYNICILFRAGSDEEYRKLIRIKE